MSGRYTFVGDPSSETSRAPTHTLSAAVRLPVEAATRPSLSVRVVRHRHFKVENLILIRFPFEVRSFALSFLQIESDQQYRLDYLSSAPVEDLTYTYDPAGNIDGITDNLNSSFSRTFVQDALDRITSDHGAFGVRAYHDDYEQPVCLSARGPPRYSAFRDRCAPARRVALEERCVCNRDRRDRPGQR